MLREQPRAIGWDPDGCCQLELSQINRKWSQSCCYIPVSLPYNLSFESAAFPSSVFGEQKRAVKSFYTFSWVQQVAPAEAEFWGRRGKPEKILKLVCLVFFFSSRVKDFKIQGRLGREPFSAAMAATWCSVPSTSPGCSGAWYLLIVLIPCTLFCTCPDCAELSTWALQLFLLRSSGNFLLLEGFGCFLWMHFLCSFYWFFERVSGTLLILRTTGVWNNFPGEVTESLNVWDV